MKTLFAATLLLFVAGFSAPIAWAQLPTAGSNTSRRQVPQSAPTQQIFVCTFNVPNGPSYVNETLIHADPASDGPIIEAWYEYLRATYGITYKKGERPPAGSGCYALNNDDPSAQQYVTLQEQYAKARGEVIRVHWTYTPASTPAAAPAAPARNTAAPPSSVSSDPCTSSQPGNRRLIPGCGAATPTVSYVVCSASDASATAYVSATFQVTAMDNPGWTNGFAQLLSQKYSYKGGGVGCTTLHEDAAQTYLRGRVIGLRANGKTVVETGWTFASAPAVAVAAAPPITTSAPAAPAPPPAAPPRAATPAPPKAAPVKPVPAARYAVCFAIMGPPARSVYFSDPFEVTAPRTKVWSDAFREMLSQKYQFVGTISCGIRGATLEDAQTFAQTQKDTSRQGRKIVDTGWKFQE